MIGFGTCIWSIFSSSKSGGGDGGGSEWDALDGFVNAPTGTPQLPNALSGFAARPPWRVAGVDYRVGPNTGTVFKNPASDTPPAGVEVGPNYFKVVQDNVTIDGWDFTQGNGWTVWVFSGNNCTIKNCKFEVTVAAPTQPIYTQNTDNNNLLVQYCTINGNNIDVGNGAVFEFHHNGWTIEYCYFENIGSDVIQQVNNGTSCVLRYCVINGGGMAGGDVHGDYTQLAGGPFDITFDFNLTIQSSPGGITQGLMTEYNNIGSTSYNTMIGDTNSPSYFISVDKSLLTGDYTVQNNYWANPSAGFCYSGSGNSGYPGDAEAKTIFTGNVNMVTGLPSGNDS